MVLFLLIFIIMISLFVIGTYLFADKIGNIINKIIKFFNEEEEKDYE